ncbi:MAG: carbohydrate kinase [Lachnospiraceae bacterium]|nr:carbohydrate kinase [Lachnospiraceae bacterium]
MRNARKYDIVALGELLIDFIPVGESDSQNPVYEANPGGAPGNVLAMAEKYGRHTAFIGKIGDDVHGTFLKETVENAGIDTSGLIVTEIYNTTLAFVSIDAHGERSFSFYRNPGADMTLTVDEVKKELIENARIFHFGTLSMTHDTVKKATKYAVEIAKEQGCLISFDPNLRPLLWNDLNDAKEQMLYGVSVCDVLKIEEDELRFMTGIEDIYEAVQYLRDHFHVKLILVTAGAKGCEAFWNQQHIKQEAFLTEKTIDTTGAGDTFFGYCLACLIDFDIDALEPVQVVRMLQGASAASSIVTTRKGAMKSMPEMGEVERLLKERGCR